MRFFRTYTKNRKGIILYATLFSLIQSLLLLPSVYFIKLIFDANIPNRDISGLITNSVIIIAITLLQSVATILYRNKFLTIVKETISWLQGDILKSLIHAEREFYDHHLQANISNRSVNDVDQVDKMMDAILSVAIPQSTLFAIGVLIMLAYNPLIGLCTLGLGLFGFILQRNTRKKVFEKIKRYNEAKDNMTTYVNVIPAKQIMTKMRNTESIEVVHAMSYSEKLISTGTEAASAGWKIKISDELIINISATLLIIVGSFQILLGSASYGNIFGLYFLILFIRRSVGYVQTIWPQVQEGAVSLERIFELLDKLRSSKSKMLIVPHQFDGSIQIQNVSFGYAEKLILKDFNLEIEQGKITCITGINGAGKSSLINLILGFYKPQTGIILASGLDYAELDLGVLRSTIGYVPQEQLLLDGTIESNLMYGHSDSKGLNKLQATKLYKNLMDGFDLGLKTIVISDGKNLSNGQIQRISILRALVSASKLLILDEPGNHLDNNATFSLIQEIKNELEISVLIISHHELFQNIADSTYKIENGSLSVFEGE